MRWGKKSKIKLKTYEGDRRIRMIFLLKPLTISGETRWLEFVSLEQIFINGNWESVRFVED